MLVLPLPPYLLVPTRTLPLPPLPSCRFDCGLAWPYASSAVNPSGPANLLHGSAGSPPAGPAGGGMPHSFSLTPPSSSG